MKKVAVLLSTFNGEKYLKEQVESILDQIDVKVKLFIRDDGSSDSTKDILQNFENNEDLTITYGDNFGVGNSFMNLVYQTPESFDYYAFADQDDIWLGDKLIKAIQQIENEETELPVLYTSNQTLVDAQGYTIKNRYQKNPGTCYLKILNQNMLSGCTMVWNSQLQCALRERRPSAALLNNRIHDVWVAMVAACIGIVIYDNNSHILYRQHENNVVGVKKESYINTIISKIKNKEKRNGRSILAKEILGQYKDSIRDDSIIKHLTNYASYQDSFKNKLALIKDKSLGNYSDENRISIVLKILLNLF